MAGRNKPKKAKKTKKDARRRTTGQSRLALVAPPDEQGCTCPACTGELDPEQLVADLTADAPALLESSDPFDAEVFGTYVHGLSQLLGSQDEFEAIVLEEIVPALVAEGSTTALALLLSIGSVGSERLGAAAAGAAAELTAAGVEPPRWAAELVEPVAGLECWRGAGDGVAFYLLIFERAGRRHGLVVAVAEVGVPVLMHVAPVPSEDIDDALETMRSDLAEAADTQPPEPVEPAQARAAIEAALGLAELVGLGDLAGPDDADLGDADADDADLDDAGLEDADQDDADLLAAGPMAVGDPDDDAGAPEAPRLAEMRALLVARLAWLPEPAAADRTDPAEQFAQLQQSMLGEMLDERPRADPPAGADLPPKMD